ncbi:MAG: hypothetical protein ABFD08_06475 [Syntrophomonas sp.]
MSEDASKNHRSQARNNDIQMPDFVEMWKELYFSNESDWARALKGFISTDTFVALLDKTLEQYLACNKVTRQQVDKMTEKGVIPTKKDIARVAELVISMEEKIDFMEFQFFDNFRKMTDSLIKMADYQEKLGREMTLIKSEIDAIKTKIDDIYQNVDNPTTASKKEEKPKTSERKPRSKKVKPTE